MIRPVKIIIDPLKINERAKGMDVLHGFLQSKETGIWHSNEDYRYQYKNVNYALHFTRSILKRPSEHCDSGSRIEIFDSSKPMAKGGFGVVYPISGTITFTMGKPRFKSSDTRVVKVQDHSPKDKSKDVLREYSGLLTAGHLRIKNPIFVQESLSKKSYLVMDKAPGASLEKILHPPSSLTPKLTLLQRIELTKAILQAIKAQVTDRGLIHRDIKPGNIMIDLHQSPPIVTIIDYGFAIKEDEQDGKGLGTRAYRPPESFKSRMYTAKSDVYSAGRVLSYLWGDKQANYYIKRDKNWSYVKSKSTNKDLFTDHELTYFLKDNEQQQIKALLEGMLQVDSALRFDINEAITRFCQIDFQPLELEHLNDQIIQIQTQLKRLKYKEFNLRVRKFETAADAIKRLIDFFEPNTKNLIKDCNPEALASYRKACKKEIDRAKIILTEHRDLCWLLAELAAAVSLLGVGYLVAVGVNYYQTGRVGLFFQTQSEQLVNEASDLILDAITLGAG